MGADSRGFWYNPKKNQLEGILYNNQGSYIIPLDANGFPKPIQIKSFAYGLDPQAPAAYNNGNVYFANEYGYVFKFKQGKTKSKDIKITEAYNQWFNLNIRGIFHTGKKGYEIGFFNFINGMVILFNEKTGNVAANVKLDIPSYVTYPEAFNLGYCNDRIFLYDKTERQWFGFKIF